MTEHLHETFIPGCFRCDLGLDEVGDGGHVVIRTGDLRALAAAREERDRLAGLLKDAADDAIALREALEIIRPWIRPEPHTGTRGGIYLSSPLLSVEVSSLLRAALAREATDADR